MAASNKDALRELMENQERATALDKKWRSRKPEKPDFDLEGVDLSELISRKKAHEINREKRADEIKRSIPPEKAWSSISFGWEGWTMLVLCIIIFIYYKMVGTPTRAASIVVSILSVGIVAIYFVRALKAKSKRKKEIADLTAYRAQVLREPFADEDKYERALDFAKALSDYQIWQDIKKPAHWKELSASDTRREISMLYETCGKEVHGTYDEYIDFLAESGNDTLAVGCPGIKKVTAKFANGFIAEMEDENASCGVVYAFGNIENAAKDAFEKAGVRLLGLEDILKLTEEAWAE